VNNYKKYIVRFITLVVAIQLLNLSIYAQDFKPIYTAVNSTETNITETIFEYIFEVVFDQKNAIPEQSQHHKDLHFHKHISFKAIGISKLFPLPALVNTKSAVLIPLSESFAYMYKQEINPPPPKSA
jgi:hypothetical protein